MTAGTDALNQLARALDQTEALITRIRPDQAGLPTPDSDWDVRELVNHIVGSVQRFAVRVSGGDPIQVPEADLPSEDWPDAYRRAADDLLAAWSVEGILERPLQVTLGEVPATWAVTQQIAELAVHAWDVARATGQSTDLDPEIGQLALDWARQNLKPEFRGSAFGPEVPVPEEAPIYDRLAGFFGRDVSWGQEDRQGG